MPEKNPYRPGASTTPRYLAGREPELKRFPKVLRGAPEIPANVRITGLRGVGKSVLLKELEQLAIADEWVASRVQLEPRHNDETSLVELVANVTHRAIERMSRGNRIKAGLSHAAAVGRGLVQVSYEDLTFGLTTPSGADANLGKALYDAVTEAGQTGHAGYVLMLDEAQVLRDDSARQGQHPLSMLIAAINTLQEAQLPIALVVCGLPTLRANLQRARTYSERMFRGENITRLDGNPGPARDAFVKPLEDTGVTATPELVERVLTEVEGYPFFIQLWGAELWDAASDAGQDELGIDLLDAIEIDIYRRLDEEFYRGRVETLTPSEQDVLIATARCPYPPLKTADVRRRSAKSDSNINVLMGRLAEQGVVYRVQKGEYEYTAPKFHEYLKRRIAQTGNQV